MLRELTVAAALVSLSAVQVQAQESEAKSWGLTGQELARFQAKVVDIECELGGECPDNCGDGRHQLGLVDSEGTLIPVAKNTQPAFNGAVYDLLPYCGKDVEVDGLFSGHSGFRFYQVQLIKEVDAEEFAKTNLWTKVWAEKFPEAEGEGPWFRRDPRIQQRIEANGYLGLGPEADEQFIAEW
ncbi:MAG: hypothetical protein ACFB6S_03700 [Geminicoccaceae bacterium]